MTDTPIADALANLPKNELDLEGSVDNKMDPKISGTLDRQWDGNTVGVEGSVAKQEGWGIKAFFRKVWK